MPRRLVFVLVAGLLAGCATRDAVFVTKTSLSIIDADATPASISIAFDRAEGYAGPRADDGVVYPVTGYLQTSGKGLSREVKQVFAGGPAAALVLQDGTPPPPGPASRCDDGRAGPPLFFATGTTLGLKVGFSESAGLPNAFTLGYKRKELAIVPVSASCHPAVLASIDSDAGARAVATDAKANLAVTQYFATGKAAEALAARPEIRSLFRKNAEAAMGDVAAFNERERRQGRLALDVLACAGRVPEGAFGRVVNNAEDLGLFPDAGAATRIRAATGIAEQRRLYGELLSLRVGDSDAFGDALAFHKQRTCALAQPQ
ncbi:hypothetical protein [Roseateles sp.]|uniref:hypothetical protein n=1 Tax=Roseateles sp. TaxID=1971397 RepID=UPI003BA8D598